MATQLHANAQLIDRFYAAFMARDTATMSACYHPEAHFTDPVFDLRGKEIGAMWSMLCTRGKDLELSYSDVEACASHGSARWEARYTFGATGRQVHNIIRAQMRFADGLILHHADRFPFWRWATMALGAPGLLLGWSGGLRRKVSREANRSLRKYIEKHPELV